MAPKIFKLSSVVVLVLIAVMIPGFICTLFELQAAASISALGAFVGLMAFVHSGTRDAVWASVAVGAFSVALVLAASRPWLIALIFFVIGVSLGVVAKRGAVATFSMVAIAAGFVLSDVPQFHQSLGVNTLLVGLVMLGSSLLVVFVVSTFLTKIQRKPPVPISTSRAMTYGVTLGVLLALASYFVDSDNLAHAGAWLILTITVVLQPYLQDGFVKGINRAAGTILGFFIAIGIATSTNSEVLLYCAAVVWLILVVTAVIGGKPYWEYATALTVAVVLLTGSSTSILNTAQERLWATVVGAGLCLGVTALMTPFVRGAAKKSGLIHY